MRRSAKLILVILAIGFFASCTKDENTNTNPTPSNPSDPRSALVGTWVCNEQSQSFGTTTYSVDLGIHSSITNRIIVSNFYNFGFAESIAQMELSGNNITIFEQTLSTGFTILGTGTLVNNSTINLSYTTDDGSGIDNVTSVYTKN